MLGAHPHRVRRPPSSGGAGWAWWVLCWGLLAASALLLAQEAQRILPAGSSKDEVLATYGWPSGQSKLGAKEILSYPQGRIVIEDGKVEQIDFSLKQPWPPPRPRPDFAAQPTDQAVVPVEEVVETKVDPLPAEPVKPVKPPPRPVAPKPVAKGDTVSAQSSALFSWLFSTRRVVLAALALGIAVVGILLWLVWRNWVSAPRPAAEGEMTMRISDAASGLPSQHDLLTWPRERIVKLLAAFMEAEGYQTQIRPAGGEVDIILRRAGDGRGQVVILCAGSEVGEVSLKRAREFFATMTVEGVDHGWYVAPAGFAAEAKTFATQHKIQLLDGPELTAQLRELPPLVLPKVLAKAAGK